jgi:hypothetical protein
LVNAVPGCHVSSDKTFSLIIIREGRKKVLTSMLVLETLLQTTESVIDL